MSIFANITRKFETSDGESRVATSLRNLITSDRIKEITELSESLEISRNHVSLQLFGLEYDQLSNSAADDVIVILRNLSGISETIH